MIQIVTYTIEELLELVQRETYANLPVIPITVQRVLSIANSPRTKPGSKVLACAYQDTVLVGYLGLLPDNCLTADTTYDIGWLSSMWVSADQRGKGIAPQLINSLLDAWNNMVLTTNQSPAAATVFNKHAEFNIIPNDGIRFYIKSRLAHHIPKKKPISKPLRNVLTFADTLINLLVNVYRSIKPKEDEIIWHTTLEVTPELALFIEENSTISYCNRKVEEFSWILNYPWIYQAKLPDSIAGKYEFTISTPDYRNEFILCYHQQKLVGAALVMLKNGELKISYAWVNPQHQTLLAKALNKYINEHAIFEITVFNKQHQNLITQPDTFYLFKRKISRPIYACNKLIELLKRDPKYFIDGDGDSCFA